MLGSNSVMPYVGSLLRNRDEYAEIGETPEGRPVYMFDPLRQPGQIIEDFTEEGENVHIVTIDGLTRLRLSELEKGSQYKNRRLFVSSRKELNKEPVA